MCQQFVRRCALPGAEYHRQTDFLAEPRVFYRNGGGALYAVVTHLVAETRLTTSGQMGMPGARQYVKTYELESDGDRTIVRTTASTLGDISDERRDNYRRGGLELLDALKAHVEKRVA